MIVLARNLLLYQYKMSPNASGYLESEGAVHVDPFDRMTHMAAPDSLDAVCNIYEAFRSIVSSVGEGESADLCVGCDGEPAWVLDC